MKKLSIADMKDEPIEWRWVDIKALLLFTIPMITVAWIAFGLWNYLLTTLFNSWLN